MGLMYYLHYNIDQLCRKQWLCWLICYRDRLKNLLLFHLKMYMKHLLLLSMD